MRGKPMGDVSFNSPLISDEPLPLSPPLPSTTAKDDQILGLMSAGWTNERHRTYISSMEASFMDQLYGVRKHGPADANTASFGNHEFKVIQEDICQNNIGFEGTNARPRDGGGPCQPVNTYVRRFKPAVNHRGGIKEASIDDYGSGTESVQKKVHTYGREAKSCAERNLIGKSKEVSDQNFSEEDVEADDEPRKRRRPRSTSAEPNDQPT